MNYIYKVKIFYGLLFDEFKKKSLNKNFKLNEHSNECYDNDEHEPIEIILFWIFHPTDFETIQTSFFA